MQVNRDVLVQALDALDCIYSPLHVREINKVGAAMAALRAALADQPQTTHWQGCEEVHHECAIAEVERLRRNKKEIADYVRAQYPDREALEQQYQAGCDHCRHPLYCGIKCGVCGRSS